MSESFLSFASSSSFRNTLITRNLVPYNVPGTFSPQISDINYETILTVANVIDSPNDLVRTNKQANILYPLNEYGPEKGFRKPLNLNGPPLPVEPNKGPYDPNDTAIDLVNEFFIDAAYVQNNFGPEGGYKNLITITDITTTQKSYLPYWDPPTFVPSVYSPYDILFNSNPTGNNGSLSQDSYIAKIGATQLKGYFEDRVAREVQLLTTGRINLNSFSDPFSTSLIATGKQPLIEKNWKITVPENLITAAVSFSNRLSGTYFPASFIPGDYFDNTEPKNSKAEKGLNVVNNLTGGLLGPILNKYRNPSEIFVANTGNGQRSALFSTLDYNKYRPDYNRGIIQTITTGISNLLNPDKPNIGGYYVGSSTVDPSKVVSPPNQLPVSSNGEQIDTLVYGPSELGILFEGNQTQINFGLKAKSYTNSGAIDGEFVWTSPKYKDNAGSHVAPGGTIGSSDGEFNVVEANYNKNLSTNITFKEGSILDQTQRIIQSADNLQGESRLKHVGNAINQVSKVFNDGYKELTKGSQVLSYKDQSDGTEAGIEYCRVFQKDTPYFTYADLQKTDGITTAGRGFTYSVFDNTYNLNIAPLKNPGSTNIIDNKVKKYMFSIENLAWRTSDRPGFTYDELPVCEKGPNGGRIMWFPPYDISFSDNSKPDFNATNFLGRPEPIYTYKNTSRSGTLKWKIVVDNPASLNTIIEKQLANTPKEKLDSIIDSFFAGCMKYDLYELGIKFNTIPTKDLFTYQEILNNPRLTEEEFGEVLKNIPVENTNTKPEAKVESQNSGGNENSLANDKFEDPFKSFEGLGFYFFNDIPFGEPATSANADFDFYIKEYEDKFYQPTINNAPASVYVGTGNNKKTYTKDQIPNFFNDVVKGNFAKFSKEFLAGMEEVVIKRKGTVKIQLQGSASAVAAEDYNVRLSQRRISAIQQWIEKQKFSDGTTYKDYIGKQILYTKIEPKGENETIPKGENGGNFEEVNCRVLPRETANGKASKNAVVNSIPAMACRRVILKSISAEIPPPQPVTTTTTTIAPNIPVTGVTITPTKPIPQVDVQQKIKEGISKKVLRQLFSECDYFQVIKETNPMVYDTFKEKIKYFSPAFHSMTPEGLNARLTFLNQCMRPGQTIPVIGPDGRPKYNDALNTSFGAPPILVLRVGDFYHSKIVPTSLDITYEPLIFDLNPEGIGIQPMVAQVNLSFNIIGGMGLKEPVEQLQNALSFNYYANTEIYDERATPTEDVSARDKYVVEQILNRQKTVSSNSVDNQKEKKGGTAIGNILTTIFEDNGNIQSGEIEYNELFKELSDKTNKYYKTINNQLRTIQNTSNYGILQLVGFKRNYSKGKILFYSEDSATDVRIYGKPYDVENRIDSLTKNIINDIEDDKDPIMSRLAQVPNIPKSAIRDVRDKLKSLTNSKKNELNQTIIEPINEMTKYQEDYVLTLKKVDAIIYDTISPSGIKNGADGQKLETGDIMVFEITEIDGGSNFQKMEEQYKTKVGEQLNSYEQLLMTKEISFEANYIEDETSFFPLSDKLSGNENCRFYMLWSDTFVKDDKYQIFSNDLLNLEKVKLNTYLENELKKTLENLKKLYKEEFDLEIKKFDDYEKSPEYLIYDKFELEPIETKLAYTTEVTVDKNRKKTIMKSVYSDKNKNFDNVFNDKVKFN
jgi:hypothetical protein